MSIITPLSPTAVENIKKIVDPIKIKYIKHSIKEIEKAWSEHYNRFIKDETWPDCDCFDDWKNLPDWIKQECVTQHNFFPEVYIDSIYKDAEKLFSIKNATVLDHTIPTVSVLERNLDLIQDKKIIDFACNSGKYSFFCSNNGSSEIIGVDAKIENIEIANIIKDDLKLSDDKIKFQISDIHDYEKNKFLCQNKDVVLLFGIMYHVHDHYAILESICQPQIEYVMIETAIHADPDPVIFWKTEPTFELRSGWHQNRLDIMVGYPSISWFDLAMKHFDMEKIDTTKYDISISASHQDSKEYKQERCVMIYKKQKT